MFNKIKKFFFLLKEFNNLNLNLQIFSRKIAFQFEQFIQQEDKKRKSQMSQDRLAKEILLYEDCYIIPKEELKEYISKEFI